MSTLRGVMAAAAEVDQFCRSHNWRFCFIGGVAVQRWGKPRFTQDVDITLLAGFGEEEKFADELLRQFPGRLRDARQFAIEHRVILARTTNGTELDIALGAFPFEEAAIHRATPWEINDSSFITTCSAEDLVVHKVFAGRDRDWSDAETILARQHGRLNLDQIRTDLLPLLELKEDVDSRTKFESLVSAVNKRLEK